MTSRTWATKACFFSSVSSLGESGSRLRTEARMRVSLAVASLDQARAWGGGERIRRDAESGLVEANLHVVRGQRR